MKAKVIMAAAFLAAVCSPSQSEEENSLELKDKTLVAWVSLANTKQRAGAVITLINKSRQFDAIVFAEKEPGRKRQPGNLRERHSLSADHVARPAGSGHTEQTRHARHAAFPTKRDWYGHHRRYNEEHPHAGPDAFCHLVGRYSSGTGMEPLSRPGLDPSSQWSALHGSAPAGRGPVPGISQPGPRLERPHGLRADVVGRLRQPLAHSGQ